MTLSEPTFDFDKPKPEKDGLPQLNFAPEPEPETPLNNSEWARLSPEEKKQRTLFYPKGPKKIPLIQETVMTLTKFIVSLVGVLVAVIALFRGVYWFEAIIRTGITIIILGFIGWGLNVAFARFLVDAAYHELKDEMPEETPEEMTAEGSEKTASTLEFEV